MQINFNVAIIGGGHAGIEAAYAAAELGCRVAIFTLPEVPVASTPCNPSVGGVAKGQVVREIDALGGLMGRLSDLAGIQYRTLNDSKGYAVKSTRVQVDKETYSHAATETLKNHPNITFVFGKVVKFFHENSIFAIGLASGEVYKTNKLVITAGTFLKGKLHFGSKTLDGGRVDSEASDGIRPLFPELKLKMMRFKTGTPPRLLDSSIEFGKLEKQPSDEKTRNFHMALSPFERKLPQRDCYLTKTTPEAMEVIRANLSKSPLFNGQIEGIGPRYCPSIEDKAYRYPDRDIHHIFVEPEGLSLNTYYPSGLSTSLPESVQLEFLKKIPGFENVKIEIPGYSVEYDVIDTTALERTLESKEIKGLYFAGQVNGTSGYEEAAGQGIMAGINAALAFLNREPVTLDRFSSYIGTMIDDLISNKRDEPYRLFTSRSENRLYLREDNSILRMAKFREKLGPSKEHDHFLASFMRSFNTLKRVVSSDTSLRESIKREIDPVFVLLKVCQESKIAYSFDVIKAVAVDIKYQGYIKRNSEQMERMQKLDDKKINWEKLMNSTNISFECKLRIEAIRPSTFGQLRLIEGIRQATLAYVAGSEV